MASQAYEEKRDGKGTVAVWTVKVSFPAFEALPAKSFYWATSKMEVDGESFDNKLIGVPNGRHQRDRGNDFASFAASNPNNALYNDFYQYEDLIERAEVLIKECYEIEYGYFESEKRFFGYLKDFNLDESDKSLKFTAMSDLSRSGFLVGSRILTRERCGTNFNVNGLESPLLNACGWQTIQGGNTLYCSRFLVGADGCASHNNTHRFYAVKGLSDAEITVVSGNTTGFPYSTGSSCFIAGTLVLMADWTLKPIELVEVGDSVLGFDIFTDRLKPTTVLTTLIHSPDQYEDAILATGFSKDAERRNFGVTREHLFYKGSATFQAYIATIGQTLSGITKDGKRAEIASIGSKTIYGKVNTYNFQTTLGTYHVSSADKKIISKVHNLKPFTTVS